MIDAWETGGTGLAPVSVDLSGLTFCDASGLNVLARIARHARQAGRQLRLTAPRPSLLKIMRITGLDRAFPELAPRQCNDRLARTDGNHNLASPDKWTVTIEDDACPR